MEIKLKNIDLELIDYRTWVPIQGNLKDLFGKNYDKLKASFEGKGGFVPAFIWKHEGQNKILDAHQRHRLFTKENAVFVHPDGTKDTRYPCIVVEAESLKDAKEKLLIISSQYGTITQEGLDEFAVDLDLDWMEDTVNFDGIFTDGKAGAEEEVYNRKIESPIYEAKSTQPKIEELFNEAKYKSLIESINRSEIKEEEKRFLRLAAARHIVFDFENIAEYYCHCEPVLQELFEESALVIIDFNRAIEDGYVKLSSAIMETFLDDYE